MEIALKTGISIEEYHNRVEENYGLLWGFLHKFHLDPEEFYGDAAIGICKAALYYDESYGVRFSSFAFKCMWTECGRTMRTTKRQEYFQFVPLNRLVAEDLYQSYTNILSDCYVTGDAFESLEYVRWFIWELSTMDLQIILLRIMGDTYQKIADVFGCTKQWVNFRMKRIGETYLAGGRAKTKRQNDNEEDRVILIEQILMALTAK